MIRYLTNSIYHTIIFAIPSKYNIIQIPTTGFSFAFSTLLVIVVTLPFGELIFNIVNKKHKTTSKNDWVELLLPENGVLLMLWNVTLQHDLKYSGSWEIWTKTSYSDIYNIIIIQYLCIFNFNLSRGIPKKFTNLASSFGLLFSF